MRSLLGERYRVRANSGRRCGHSDQIRTSLDDSDATSAGMQTQISSMSLCSIWPLRKLGPNTFASAASQGTIIQLRPPTVGLANGRQLPQIRSVFRAAPPSRPSAKYLLFRGSWVVARAVPSQAHICCEIKLCVCALQCVSTPYGVHVERPSPFGALEVLAVS